MKNRLLTLGDLYEYFEKEGKDIVFSSLKTNTFFAVQIPGKAIFEDTSTEGLTKCHIKAMHAGDNKNHIYFADDVMKNALPSFKTRPILGNIREVNGQLEFGGHDFYEETDPDTGEVKRIYEERPIGVTSSIEEPYTEYDSEQDKYYVHVEGYLFDDYSDAKEIIKREGGISDVSMEINIEQLSYNAAKHTMEVQQFRNTGITVLGKDDSGEEIDPAMVGANITLADFEADENSSAYFNAVNTKEFAETVDKLQKMLAAFSDTSKSSKKGGTQNVNKFEELLAKYSVTTEQITFEYDGLSDEELEAKFAEAFEDSGDSADGNSNTSDSGDNDAGTEGSENETEAESESENETDNSDDTAPVLGASNTDSSDAENADDISSKKKIYSITDPSGKTFSVSLEWKSCALNSLVNSTYAEADNDYYSTETFDDHVIMFSWCTGRIYKQSYAEENDNFTLIGERVEVFTEYLTAEEQNTLKVIRGEYAELKEYKESNEAAKATAAKDEVFAKFSEILAGNTEFEELKKGEFSAEELELRCNALVGKKQMATFAAHDENKAHKVLFDFNGKTEEKKPYGGLFDDEK